MFALLWQWLIAPFAEFDFMLRALAGCIALSLSAPLVGVFFNVTPHEPDR